MNTLRNKLALLAAAAVLGLSGCATSGKDGGNSYFDDAATTMRVKKAIYNEPSLKVTDVSVTTDDGVVTLTGAVKNKGHRMKAEQVVRKVDGVKKVKNELKVE